MDGGGEESKGSVAEDIVVEIRVGEVKVLQTLKENEGGYQSLEEKELYTHAGMIDSGNRTFRTVAPMRRGEIEEAVIEAVSYVGCDGPLSVQTAGRNVAIGRTDLLERIPLGHSPGDSDRSQLSRDEKLPCLAP